MFSLLTILSLILVPLASSLGPDLVIEVSRHGARAPFNLTYDKEGYWTGLQGQLTGVGMRMSYILGAAYREDYPDLLNLYDPSTIYARSTDTDYSIMGAYSKLFGVYNGTGPGLEPDYPAYLTDPPFNDTLVSEVTRDLDNSYAIPYNFQPVPVHIVEMKYDTVLMGAGPACPQSKEWITANSEDYEVGEIYRKYMQDVVKHLRGNNINVNSFGDLYVFADLAAANKHEDITIPGNIKEESPYYKDLKFAYEWYTTKLFQNLNIQKQLNALNLLTYVVDVMDDKASGTSNLKFAFMSGHDSTILAVLSAFNITNKDCLLENYLAEKQGKDKPYPLCHFPKFTSNLKFELYDSVIPTVKFYFNDVLVEICGSGDDCSLDEFEEYVKKVTNSYTVQDYNALCGLKSQQKKTSQSSSKTTVIMLGALTVVLAVGLSMICYQKKKGQVEGDVGGGYRIQA